MFRKIDCYVCHFILHFTGLVFSYDDLSFKKFATQSSTMSFAGSDANNAIDRNITTCSRTNDIGGTSVYKTVWWKVDLGGAYSIYSISILFKKYDAYDFEMRQRGRFAGFSLYISDTGVIEGSILCYKDGPQLPPLNFTTTCMEHGRYVIFYNERMDRVSYPDGYQLHTVVSELCEVIVFGCAKPGVYGTHCNMSCPGNCKNQKCQIENGTCFTCEPGWIGIFCTIKCTVGKYGADCKEICNGHCEDNAFCNHVTGQCDGGCAVGWSGYLCDKECDDETYGYNCVNNCSGHCLNNSPCNTQTGHCDMGCIPGYTNKLCSEKCIAGYYGSGCRNLCNGYCINDEVCHHIEGICITGCREGYIGRYCNNTCKAGYFGRECSSVCSPHCKTCRHTDGHCSCLAGYTGYRCNTACFQSYGENCRSPCSKHCYNKNCDGINGSCLTGCTGGFYDAKCDKDIQALKDDKMPSNIWVAGLIVSLVFNIIFISVIYITCRGKRTKKESIFRKFFSCWRKSFIYQDTKATIEQTSTYQELTVPVPKTELPYHNTKPK